MRPASGILDMAWRAVVAGLVFAMALVATRLLFTWVGWSAPRMPAQAPEEVAGWYLLAGSLVLAGGLVPAARGLGGRPVARWLVLASFLFLGFGVSTTVEASIYSTVEGMGRTIALMLLPCVVLAGVTAGLLPSPAPRGRGEAPHHPAGGIEGAGDRRALRLAAALIAFPVLYFVFGVLVSPLVSGYYEEGVAGLVLPDPGVILSTQLFRGGLHLLAALPVIHFWRASKGRLALALGVAFFVFVAAWDFVLAYQVPAPLVAIHGVEVLASSLVYGWVLATLLVRDAAPGSAERAGSEEVER